MNPLLYTLIALSLLVTGLRAQAQTLPATGLGAVENVYVRIAPGVFIEKTLSQQSQDPGWSDVRLQAAISSRARNRLARNPEALDIRQGDIVQMEISAPPQLATGPLAGSSRVVARVAAAGTPRAGQLGREIAGESPLTLAEAIATAH